MEDKFDILDALAERMSYDYVGIRLYDESATAVLYALGEKNRAELIKYCNERLDYYPLYRYFDKLSNSTRSGVYKVNQFIKYKRNEPISLLLKWFCDSKSRKVGYSRGELKVRFITQTRKDQIKILKTFLLSSNEKDREWAAQWANRDWSKSFVDPLMKALDMKPSRNVSIAVIKNLPLEYVRENSSILAEIAPVDLCIRLGQSGEIELAKYKLNILEYLYCTAMIKRKIPESQLQIEQRLFAFLHQITSNYEFEKCLHPISIQTIPMIGKAIWGLGVHGMTDVLLRIIDLMRYAYSGNRYPSWYDEFDKVTRWIQEEWEMDDKEHLIDMIQIISSDSKVAHEENEPDLLPPKIEAYYRSNVEDESDLDDNIRGFIDELF